MHDIEIHPDNIATGFDAPISASSVSSCSIVAAINARTPLNLTTRGIVGDSVDIINNLTTGALVRKLANTPPGPQTRTFELGALPDFGGGSLALPRLNRVGTRGVITFVNDVGVAAQGPAITGISLTGGAYLKSSAALPGSLDLSTGWSLFFSFRTPTGSNNSSRTWASLGRRTAEGTYGIQLSETSSGQVSATVQDPRFGIVTIRSNATTRSTIVNARLSWNASTQLAQWFVNGVASGAAVPLPFVPDVATGNLLVGTNLGESTSVTPVGSIHQIGLEVASVSVTDSFVSVPSVTTLTEAEAATLHIDTINNYYPSTNAGSVSVRYSSASGPEGADLAVSIAGYTNVVERLSRYISGDSFWSTIQLGSTRIGQSSLVLTPPALGAIRTSSSVEFRDVGTLVNPGGDGTPLQPYITLTADEGGSNGNPAGSITRGWSGIMRLQQQQSVREVTLTELNNPPRLNGGGEGWGHADDVWVPIHSLWFGYEVSNFIFPRLPDETPTVTVTAIPSPGEGSVRVLRTGPDLRVGDRVAWSDVRRIGWAKAGVSAVSPACRLSLRLSAPGAPDGNEDYLLKITDAIRPAGLTYWGFPTANYSDQATNTRWANRGGDWTGVDGLYGAQPFVQTSAIVSAQTATLDVTQMARSNGAEFFIIAASTSGTVSITPPAFAANPANEPMLRVTGGARAGTYRASRWGSLSDSDSSTWKPTNTGSFVVRRTQPTLLAFDGAGTPANLTDATRIELVLVVTGTSGGGSSLQIFRPTPQPPRPGPRIAVTDSTPIRSRADFLVGVDRNEDWQAMLTNADSRNQRGGSPTNWTIANGCYYGSIPLGALTGMNLFRGFWRADNTGYPVIRFGRMMGWHINYQPADSNSSHPGVSGKTAGALATGKAALDGVDVGRGGISVTGLGGYTTRGQRGKPSSGRHRSNSPLHPFTPVGDYSYFINGSDHGVANYGIVPLRRMVWLWIETVHATNSVTPDGRWLRDGVFEMHVNGRKHVEYRGLEYRIAGNPWLWDAIWFDEYNGGTGNFAADRPWPFVFGPSYVVSGTAPIAPPSNWNVPFVNENGQPDTSPLPYLPDYA